MKDFGKFDSWEILDENTAIKKCDDPFFDYNGSGIPIQIRWFFDAEDLEHGSTRPIVLEYGGREYQGKVTRESSEHGRTRIFWSSELGNEFKILTNGDNSDLEAVFERLGGDRYKVAIRNMNNQTSNVLHNIFEKFMTGYLPAKQQVFSGNQFGSFVRGEIPNALYKTGLIDPSKYLVAASVGQGNWALVPWVCIFDRKITTSATKGIYIVYLLSRDCKSLYLTFNQGCTDIRNKHSKKETIDIMRKRAREISSRIYSRGFRTDENASLGAPLTELAEMYQRGIIFYKEYKVGNIPSDLVLLDDLGKMMDIYKEHVSGAPQGSAPALEEKKEGEDEMVDNSMIKHINNYIAAKGFTFDPGLIENYYLSLKSKPFVILAGTSGTGKTRLVRLFAEAIGANTQNGRYKLVPVRPDWSDSSDLLGHVDLNGKFMPGAIIDFVKAAESDLENPYFLCLDEMNLARVEYYLSDILSVIETRELVDGHIVTDPLVGENYYGADADAASKYGTVRLPENLYIIGTVNMDETTFPFSRKVLDRANTIEFSTVDLSAGFLDAGEAEPTEADNSFMKADYVFFKQCRDHADLVEAACAELQYINTILEGANSHVGYRVRDEIIFYLINNHEAKLLDYEDAMDNEIMQKILPRIQGSSASVKNMLCELFKHCAGDYDGYQTERDDISSKMFKAAKQADCKYKKSAEKIAYMVRRYEEDGFTAYWL